MNDGFTIKSMPIKWFLRRAYCDVCGSELTRTGRGITLGNTSWEHKCKCDNPRWLPVSYPVTVYEEEAPASGPP